MDRIHIRQLRSRRVKAILRVRSRILEGAREWFKRNGYTEIQTPILVPKIDEAGHKFLTVHHPIWEASLSAGAYPYTEAYMACLGRVFTITPAFRVEGKNSKRHLLEHWRIECLIPRCNLEEMIQAIEDLTIHICHHLDEEAREDLKVLERDISNIKAPFQKITYDEAIEILQLDGVEIFWGDIIEPEHERILSKRFNEPFFIKYFPVNPETLFFKSHPKKRGLSLTTDLIASQGYGEIASGGEMIDNPKEIIRKMKEEDIQGKDYQWQLNLKKIIHPPHSGFAVGIERLLMWICGLKDIKETTLFPRKL